MCREKKEEGGGGGDDCGGGASRQESRRMTSNRQSQWGKRVAELKRFREANGHCNVPIKEHPALGKFVMNQRYYYRTRGRGANSLTDARIEELDKLGFDWTSKGKTEDAEFLTHDERWERNIEELKRYKEEFGHVNVPKSGKHGHAELGSFVGMQRYLYRRRLRGEANGLTNERIGALSGLGVDWKRRTKGGESKVDIALKDANGARVVEKDESISLQDGGTVDCATKEGSEKKLVTQANGRQMLEVTTRKFATKIERIILPPPSNDETESNLVHEKSGGDEDGTVSNNNATYQDGSTSTSTVNVCSNKRIFAREDGAQVLEMVTMRMTTRVDRTYIPDESEGEIEMRSQDLQE